MRIHMKLIPLCSVLLLLLSPAAEAHKDTVLALRDGKIEGLPEKYQPATYDVERHVLRIGRHETTFAPFVESLFTERDDWDLRITSSWYHSFWILPPYICFHLAPGKRDYGYDILMNMNTLTVINITVVLKISSSSTREVSIELPAEVNGSIHKVRR
jgi:hypothetical protein